MTDLLIHLVLIAIAFMSLFPILNAFASSFSGRAAVGAMKVTVFPIDFTLSNYKAIMEDKQFFVSFGVSIQRVLLGGLLQFVLTVMLAYPLSRERARFKGRDIYMWALVIAMLFNGGLIPWYITVKSVGLLDTMWALVLPKAVPVFNVILLMNFMRNLPKELDEAAEMDGAGPWYKMIMLYIPLSLPALATVTLFSFVGHWNAFFDGLLLIHSTEKLPLQTYINLFMVQNMQTESIDPEQMELMLRMSDQGLNAAKVMLSMLPLLLLYPILQRFFIHGIVLGSVKE
ncbi:carbohydrate ABC transporter permease [Paenibacillus contaminans]|uniref:Carbohydrate ABC transporter permease n=2 Tax=Paenibacillus contaminans TaxID=450362 RepID=A0A329MKT2_9BACL|nr:carbohydrate ABC transporter permease [Paenibacillus contaminans]